MSIHITLHCNNDGCASILTTDTDLAETARRRARAAGWTHQITGRRISDFCVRRTDQIVPAGPCERCGNHVLHHFLGHDLLGHRTANTLLRAQIESVDRLEQMTDQEILNARIRSERPLSHPRPYAGRQLTPVAPLCPDDPQLQGGHGGRAGAASDAVMVGAVRGRHGLLREPAVPVSSSAGRGWSWWVTHG